MAPPNIDIEFVNEATEVITEEAVEVFASVMGSDPTAIALAGGDPALIPHCGRTMIRALVLTPGVAHMFTARNDTGLLVGFTIFSLPGQLLLSSEEQMSNAKFKDFMAMMSQEGQDFFANVMAKEIPEVNDAAFGIKESERNTYWCNFAMVRADYQGTGVAKAMFELAYKEAEKLHSPVALTTTNIRNVPIYKKIGLTYHGEKVMQSPWNEWYLWFFMKPAAPSVVTDNCS